MTLPVSSSIANPFPIEVTENDSHFLVKVPANQKERARRIPGRRWIGEISRWVYPKTLPTYDALTEEFKRDASVFDIRKPPNKRLPTPKVQPDEDDQTLDEWKDLNEKTSEIHQKFNAFGEQISIILESVRSLEAVTRETQDMVKARPEELQAESQKAPDKVQSLDLAKRNDLKLVERALVLLAFDTTGRDRSFAKWISIHQPLTLPDRFVSATHEKLKASIAQILGEPDYESADFSPLTSQLQQSNTLGLHPRENDRICNLLRAMNQHRNRFSHQAGFTESERLTRSIIYLFNLALIWPHVASEPVEENDET